MLSYIARRVLTIIPVLLFLSLLVVASMKITSEDPAMRLGGQQASEEAIELIREKFGLNEPLHVQYWLMMRNLFTGELDSI